MSSHDNNNDSAFPSPSGGDEVDTTSSLILGATGDVRYFPKITYRAQLSELSMVTAKLNHDFPLLGEQS